ncbi:MAG: DUF3348 domain-containing protein [Rudaea sp.]|uniref:DUF3348 domain-containing protein n=1 Tax=unclassified Rudaea TaxID=2627037 RepID=UPI0010F5AF17|nr:MULTISPECIES: DUF3348 domain-containing protein [unclassified Rudaea]MBN8888141.1 DUF3348 domain-containing protein [Rudaea sp.]MBR0344583.1 DUF3348 domain-containing protein [Rudaea sp.]
MVQALQRTVVRGPTFIRLLARLTDVAPSPPSQSLPDRLGQWLDWTQAIALSTALDGKTSTPDPDLPISDNVEENDCARLRATLVRAIADVPELADAGQSSGERARAGEAEANAQVDYALFRQRYVELQRKMLVATGSLRGRLRDRLAQGSGDMPRLAAVDAAMELALSAREQKLLSAVPALLGEHFERLRTDERKAPDDTGPATGAWLDVFRRDMRNVLLAELDVRFQPVEGLLAALRPAN